MQGNFSNFRPGKRVPCPGPRPHLPRYRLVSAALQQTGTTAALLSLLETFWGSLRVLAVPTSPFLEVDSTFPSATRCHLTGT